MSYDGTTDTVPPNFTGTIQFPDYVTGTATTSVNYINYLYGINFQKEWAKFRTEFIRELLREEPKGVVDFKQTREWDPTSQVYRVKVTLEYVPQVEQDVDRT